MSTNPENNPAAPKHPRTGRFVKKPQTSADHMASIPAQKSLTEARFKGKHS